MFAVTIKNLTLQYPGQTTPLIENFNLDLEEGRLHFLSGSNGSGKSTLFKAISGSLDPLVIRSGSFEGSFGQKLEAKLLPQCFDDVLVPDLSYQEHLRLKFSFNPFFKSYDNPAFKVPTDQAVGMLSGGQRQLLALQLILNDEPDLLLVDEVTAALDTKNARAVYAHLKASKATVLAICHDPELIESYCSGKHVQL